MDFLGESTQQHHPKCLRSPSAAAPSTSSSTITSTPSRAAVAAATPPRVYPGAGCQEICKPISQRSIDFPQSNMSVRGRVHVDKCGHTRNRNHSVVFSVSTALPVVQGDVEVVFGFNYVMNSKTHKLEVSDLLVHQVHLPAAPDKIRPESHMID